MIDSKKEDVGLKNIWIMRKNFLLNAEIGKN